MKRYLYCVALVGLTTMLTSYGMQQPERVDFEDPVALANRFDAERCREEAEERGLSTIVPIRTIAGDAEGTSCGQCARLLLHDKRALIVLTAILSVGGITCWIAAISDQAQQ